MHRFLIHIVSSFVLFSALASVAAAVESAFLDAEMHSLGAPTPDLERAVAALLERDDGPAWAAYTVPMVDKRRILCCGDWSSSSGWRADGTCRLERSGNSFINRDDDSEIDVELRVLLRFHKQRLTEIRTFSSDCRLDAGSLPVYVWDGVASNQSLDLLLDRADVGSKDVAEGALVAIAHHGDGEVEDVLEKIARGELLPRLEEEAVFWLGEARGDRGFDVLERLRRDIRDTDVLEKVAFALHLNEAPGALPALIDMARRHPNGDVRGSALFWLSQQAGERATAAIVEAGEEDPDLEVKERAIFALSQLPPDRGVPLLIRYARTHDSREIRKKAMFWLGQTEDPRALEFFEEVLTR